MSTKERKHPAPPRYDEAFKAGAVRMVTEQGRPSREVAAELGICIDTLRSWLKAAGAPSPGQADRQNRDARRLRELEAEIRALRKKLEEKDGVIDILKKSVGILSNVPFPVSWTVKMKKKQKETQDILSYHTQAAGCSDKARAKASGGRQPIEECGRTGL